MDCLWFFIGFADGKAELEFIHMPDRFHPREKTRFLILLSSPPMVNL